MSYGITKSKGWKKHNVNENYFDEIDTEEKAYYLGLIMADGCVYRGPSPRSYIFQINLSSKDKKELERMNEAFSSDYQIYDVAGSHNNMISELCISNTRFCRGLMEHGITLRKTENCHFPDFMNEHLTNCFLKGFFDGDGNIYHNPNRRKHNLQFSMIGTFDFISGAQQYLSENDIPSFIYKASKTDKVVILATSSYKAIQQLYKLLYNNDAPFYSRKKEIFDRYMLKS